VGHLAKVRGLVAAVLLATGATVGLRPSTAYACYRIESHDGYRKEMGAYRFVVLSNKSGNLVTPVLNKARQPYPVSGLYKDDDSLTPLWQAPPAVLSALQVFISADGRYAAAIGSNKATTTPSEAAPGIVFFRDGEEIRRYTLGDLVPSLGHVARNMCGFEWYDSAEVDQAAVRLTLHMLGYADDGQTACRPSDNESNEAVARLTGYPAERCSAGERLTFDLATGEAVVASLDPIRDTADWKWLSVAGGAVAATGVLVGGFRWQSRHRPTRPAGR
jgi:hypothetical protein